MSPAPAPPCGGPGPGQAASSGSSIQGGPFFQEALRATPFPIVSLPTNETGRLGSPGRCCPVGSRFCSCWTSNYHPELGLQGSSGNGSPVELADPAATSPPRLGTSSPPPLPPPHPPAFRCGPPLPHPEQAGRNPGLQGLGWWPQKEEVGAAGLRRGGPLSPLAVPASAPQNPQCRLAP